MEMSGYKFLKDSLKGDLFIAAEIELENQIYEIVIHHENQSKRQPIDERVCEYHCYAWLLKRKPFWSIVFFIDDAVLRKPVDIQEGETKATLSIINKLLDKGGVDWSFITNTTGANQQQYNQV